MIVAYMIVAYMVGGIYMVVTYTLETGVVVTAVVVAAAVASGGFPSLSLFADTFLSPLRGCLCLFLIVLTERVTRTSTHQHPLAHHGKDNEGCVLGCGCTV